jgi:hypothetical protein
MLYVFLGSCYVIVFSLSWLITRLVFKDKLGPIPYIALIIGFMSNVVSMYMLGWIF